MSFIWLIGHNVWSKKVRSMLTAAAVAVGVLVVVALGIVTDSIRTTAAGVLKVGAADFTISQKGLSDILESALTEQQLTRVQKTPGVKSAIGVLLDTESLDKDHPLVVEVGIRPEDLAPFGVRLAAGREFTAEAADEIMVGVRLAQDIGVGPGDTLHIGGSDKKVVGVFNTGNTFGDSTVMFPLVPFQAYERQPGGLSLFFVKVDKGTQVKALEAAIASGDSSLAEYPNDFNVNAMTSRGCPRQIATLPAKAGFHRSDQRVTGPSTRSVRTNIPVVPHVYGTEYLLPGSKALSRKRGSRFFMLVSLAWSSCWAGGFATRATCHLSARPGGCRARGAVYSGIARCKTWI